MKAHWSFLILSSEQGTLRSKGNQLHCQMQMLCLIANLSIPQTAHQIFICMDIPNHNDFLAHKMFIHSVKKTKYFDLNIQSIVLEKAQNTFILLIS
jgi:hypothetical protein